MITDLLRRTLERARTRAGGFDWPLLMCACFFLAYVAGVWSMLPIAPAHRGVL